MFKYVSVLLLLTSASTWADTVIVAPKKVEFRVNGQVQGKAIKRAFLTIRCLREATFFERFNNGLSDTEACYDFKINGENAGYKMEKVELSSLSDKSFLLEQKIIEFSKGRKGHVCLAVSAELENDNSSYQNPYDMFSLLSYCTVDTLPFQVGDYVYNNRRVKTLKEFEEKLSQPINIQLK